MKRQSRKQESEKLDWAALESRLAAHLVPLGDESSSRIPCVDFTEKLKEALSLGRAGGMLVGGLEAIETLLQREQAGLVKNGAARDDAALVSVSRLLLVSEDGSDRFYRSVGSLMRRIGGRLLVCKVRTSAQGLGLFFGPQANVKALLVARKEFVERTLKAIL